MRRVQQVAAVLKKELAPQICRELDENLGLVTVTDVEVQADLKEAKVYIGCFPKTQEKEVFKILEAKTRDFQHFLGQRLRMKFTPKLIFVPDTGLENVRRVEQTLLELKKKDKK